MKEIQRVSVTDAVAESIKNIICTGEFPIGAKLPTETKLCEELKVSRTSVREAFRLLQAQGYVEILPGRGAFVADFLTGNQMHWFQIDDAKYKDYMEVRIAIENLAVRLAVERSDDVQIAELESVHRSFLAASALHDVAKMVILDERFHSLIIEYSQNPLLSKINHDLLDVFRPYRRANFSDQVDYKHADTAHEKILQCFQKHDPELAETCMKEHLSITAEDFDRLVPKIKK
ncbi:MAG: FadR family transcriptional regulator [Clostridia bacterium]|nr:FadR family transcriptional regulator [Clostridia bacterium]